MSFKDDDVYRSVTKIILDNWSELEYDIVEMIKEKLNIEDDTLAQKYYNNVMDNLISNEKIG